VNFVGVSPFVSPLLPLVVVVVLIVVVIGAAAGSRSGAGQSTSPVAYFFYGVSLLCLGIMVSSAGVAIHAVTELVGPAPQGFPVNAFQVPCTTPSSPGPTSSPSTPPDAGLCYQNSAPLVGPVSADGSGGFVNLIPSDDRNRDISVAVAAALFGIVALVGYRLVWRRARGLGEEVELGEPPVGRLPLTYAYLVAGLSAVALLVFVPIGADNIFQAIAPGINGANGHANGVRSLVTFTILSALAGVILTYHLRYARSVWDADTHPDDGGFDLDGP
jgi:hypothetical protein